LKNDMNNDIKRWRESWLDCINQLTSFDLQKESWLDMNHSNPHWSFVEFICSYFDDLGLEGDYEKLLEDGWIKREEFEIIEEWHKNLAKYDSPKNDDYNHEAILNDSKWLEILKIGEKAKSRLALILGDREKKILTEKINYKDYI
ncbi:MAG TPA: hypothetical protein VIN10_04300, partial [Bacteroidales bacterium]